VQGLSWYWIALELAVPTPVAFLVAYLFWRKGQMIFGNIVGTGVLFGSAFALIFREHAELDILVRRCLDQGSYAGRIRARSRASRYTRSSRCSRCSRCSR
jgi:hypothetical protein